MNSNPRYSAAGRLLRLAMMMQGRPDGVSIPDIMLELQVSRRTAERMRNEVLSVFEHQSSEGKRHPVTGLTHWRILPGPHHIDRAVTTEETAALSAACSFLKQKGLDHHVEHLQSLSDKLNSHSNHLDDQIDKLIGQSAANEGYTSIPGPRIKSNSEVFNKLYTAIVQHRVINCQYRQYRSTDNRDTTLYPYGFLYGPRAQYLVAHDPGAPSPAYKLFGLSQISNLSIENKQFQRNADFNLQEYSKSSFGVYKNQPIKVTWRFSAVAAEQARHMSFHSSEVFTELKDGSLLVSFTASGLIEMCWHLFTWGNHVEIIEPVELKEAYSEMIKNIPGQVA